MKAARTRSTAAVPAAVPAAAEVPVLVTLEEVAAALRVHRMIDTGDTSDNSRVKFNPLADWTWGDVWHYIQQHEVAYNLLHDQFYPSIGCAPCTRAISQGEDFRAGRWWWESSELKECGLHVRSQTGASTSSAAWANADVAPDEVKASPEAGGSQSSELKECGLHVKPQKVSSNETQGLAA